MISLLSILMPTLVVLSFSPEDAACPPLGDPAAPIVVSAAAPRFPAIAAQARISGVFDVCVTLSQEGVPQAADLVLQPAHVMGEVIKPAALLWRFKPTAEAAEPRRVRLRFVFGLIPRDSQQAEETAIFRPPYEVEVRHLGPEPLRTPSR